ncbi:MAG: hypothetical protein Q8Q29_02145 [Actinomycetota bacterium]|nr:hypothetical protein [Actinomycetota bacterium]
MKLRMGLAVAAVLAVVVAGCSSPAASPNPTGESSGAQTRGTVWVADEGAGSLSVVDAQGNELLATITGIPGPHNVQVAPDGSAVWAISGPRRVAVKIDTEDYEVA